MTTACGATTLTTDEHLDDDAKITCPRCLNTNA